MPLCSPVDLDFSLAWAIPDCLLCPLKLEAAGSSERGRDEFEWQGSTERSGLYPRGMVVGRALHLSDPFISRTVDGNESLKHFAVRA